MVNNYSRQFLEELDNIHLRELYIELTILSWDEYPIKTIQGRATDGSININGNSSVRRTLTLTMIADDSSDNLTSLDNLIALNKKVSIKVGQKNYLSSYKKDYGEIIWFQMGVFVISQASISYSNSGTTINITGKDKMVLLNGVVGGTLPASVTFHEKEVELSNGDIQIERPTLIEIIKEAVSQFGGELLSNIFINDLNETASILVKYINSAGPMYLKKNTYSEVKFVTAPKDIENYMIIKYGQDAGYFETDFTYPGELILSAGETVDSLLSKIVSVLGNYEYFYDLEGHFIFQEKKNYLNSYYSPIEVKVGDIVDFNVSKYSYIIKDNKQLISLSHNPNYDNIKNDFIVWGVKKSVTNTKIGICYHLALDERPELFYVYRTIYYGKNASNENIYTIHESDLVDTSKSEIYSKALSDIDTPPWQEELYRRALLGVNRQSHYEAYDAELLGFWREIYNPDKEEWLYSNHWNPAKNTNPADLVYWLDFIDTNSELGSYSIKNIGRRTKVVNSDKITALFTTKVPDVIYLNNDDSDLNLAKKKEYQKIGQKFCGISENDYLTCFNNSGTGASAYDEIISLLSLHLIYNSTLSVSMLPKFYLEPNTLIYINNQKAKVVGDFMINSISLPLKYNGAMTLNLSQLAKKI